MITLNAAVLMLALVVIEGLSSYGLLIRDVITTGTIAEQRHAQYDADLGWVNRQSTYIPDMYGPGVYLKTNAQGFRSDHDTFAAVPKGKRRLVCSGDSFTLGYGVDNAHTWCELLSVLDPRLETVNMGQGGYGVDQAYLWYRRDARFEHQIQILAIITDDLYRMLSDSFSGYGKPVLDVEDGTLVVKNVPVPKVGRYATWRPSVGENLKALRTVELLDRVGRRLRGRPGDLQLQNQRERDEKARVILRALLADLKRLNEQRSSRLVIIYLPTIYELVGGGLPRWSDSDEWVQFLAQEARELDITLIDLFGDFRSLHRSEIVRLFIPKGALSYSGAEGHFTAAGNQFVAKAIHDRLVDMLGTAW